MGFQVEHLPRLPYNITFFLSGRFWYKEKRNVLINLGIDENKKILEWQGESR